MMIKKKDYFNLIEIESNVTIQTFTKEKGRNIPIDHHRYTIQTILGVYV